VHLSQREDLPSRERHQEPPESQCPDGQHEPEQEHRALEWSGRPLHVRCVLLSMLGVCFVTSGVCFCDVGVCQKVKASYLTVGHTHNDDDGDIGVSGNHMCSKDIQTLSLCEELIEESFEKFHSSGTFIVPIIGITDYGAMLPDTAAGNPFKINGELLFAVNTNIDFSALIASFAGIARAQVIRFSMVDGKCVVHYQEDPAQDGWFPRPAPLIRSEIWDTLFAHPDDPRRHGHPLTCEAFGIKDRGKRQHWQVCNVHILLCILY
jgi:hypothetical protein